ncbi:MAG: protein translocase subunit SecF [Actinobacteria bacterium]|nr:protein translocase subunit SecF [Actinomycetota bacterium]
MSLRDAVATFRGHRTPNLPLIPRRRWWFALSGFLVLLSVFGLLVIKLNLSLEFQGGAEIRYPNRAGVGVEDVRDVLRDFDRADAEIQVVGGGEISITTGSLTEEPEERDRLLEALAEQAGISPEENNTRDVGPTFGAQIGRKALQALIVFLVLVTIYIALRFEWKMAVAAQVALVHDLLITAGVYALVGREVTPATVIAILTILGYSLYDTVVIFDKIKENTESMALVARDTYSGVVNLSLNQVFMRSVNTSLSTLLPVTALLLFGGETLKDFAFALFVGVGVGTYSSIFLAAPFLAVLKEREPRLIQIRERTAARVASRSRLQAVPPSSGEGREAGEEPAAAQAPAATRSGPARPGRASPPRAKSRRKPSSKRRRR